MSMECEGEVDGKHERGCIYHDREMTSILTLILISMRMTTETLSRLYIENVKESLSRVCEPEAPGLS